jgi:uncharacterized protein (DUF433 family)
MGPVAFTVEQNPTTVVLVTGSDGRRYELKLALVIQAILETGQTNEKDAGVVGGSARIARTRIPIWTLENYRRLGASDAQVLEAFPALRRVDLDAARAYVALHAAEIEADIVANAVASA